MRDNYLYRKSVFLVLIFLLAFSSYIPVWNLNNVAFASNQAQENKLIKQITWNPASFNISAQSPIKFNAVANQENLEGLEFQLWEKHEDEDWQIVYPYQKWPFKEYRFNREGNYAIQIDVREAKNPTRREQYWLGQFYSKPVEQQRLVREISTMFSSTVMNTYWPIQFKLESERNLNELEFQLWEKYEGEDWQIVYPYQKWPFKEYKFNREGDYAIQIDVREAKNPMRKEQYWLGQFYSRTSERAKLVEGISWRPFSVVANVGQPLSFITQPSSYDLDLLEFQLWEKIGSGDWRIAQPYQKWPLASHTFKDTGVHALQIDIRETSRPNNVQKIWLGEFYPNDKDYQKKSDYIIRRVLANYPLSVIKQESFIEPLTYELNLALQLMYWDYKNYTLEEQEQYLNTIPGTRISGKEKNGVFDLEIMKGQVNKVDLINNTLSSEYVQLSFPINKYNNTTSIFAETNDLPKEVQIAAALCYLVYVNHEYSQVPNETERPRQPISSAIAHCWHFTNELYDILNHLDYQVRSVSLNYKGGAHALNEIKVNDKIYTLDSTAGVVYKSSVKELAENYSAPTILPQVRNLDFLWSDNIWMNIENFSIIESSDKW